MSEVKWRSKLDDYLRVGTDLPRIRWAALFVMLSVSGSAEAAPNARVVVSDDTFVTSSAPDQPVGATSAKLDSGEASRIFLRFRLPQLTSGRIVSATLHGSFAGWNGGPSATHAIARTIDDTWSEQSVTWNQQPAVDPAPLATFDAYALYFGDPFEIDLTSAVRAEQEGDGVLGLRIAPAASGPIAVASFWARERPGSGFRLDLVLDPTPRFDAGDLVDVVVWDDGWSGVVATDPDTGMRKLTAPMVFPDHLTDIGRDPVDGALLGVDQRGVFEARLLRFDPVTGSPQVLASGGRFAEVVSSRLAVSSGGAIYAIGRALDTSQGTDLPCLVAVDRVTGVQTDVRCDASLGRVAGIAVEPSGQLVAAIRTPYPDYANELVRIDPTTGAQTLLAALERYPLDVAVDADGTLWIVDAYYTERRLLRIDPASGASEVVAPALPLSAGRVAAEPGGTLVVGSEIGGYRNWIGRFDPEIGAFTLFLERAYGDAAGIAVAPDGSWLSAWDESAGVRVSRIDPAEGIEHPLHAWLGASAASPFRIAVDGHRRLVVLADDSWNGGRIVEVNPNTGRQRLSMVSGRLAPALPPPGNRSAPAHAITPDGHAVMAVYDYASTHFFEMDANGALTETVAVPFDVPSFQVLPDGDLLVLRFDTQSLQRIDRQTGTVAAFGDASPIPIYRIVVEPSGDVLAASGLGLARLQRQTGSWTTLYTRSQYFDFAELLVDYVRGEAYLAGADETLRVTLATGVAEVVPLRGFALANTQCSDGLDNDRDGLLDWPADPQCSALSDDSESAACGLGFELAPLSVLAWGVLRRRRQELDRGERIV